MILEQLPSQVEADVRRRRLEGRRKQFARIDR